MFCVVIEYNESMYVGIAHLHLLLPGCQSLKEKRGRVKPILARLAREFNLAVAETGDHDLWQSTRLTAVTVANDRVIVEQTLRHALVYIEKHWPDETILEEKFEFLTG